MMTATTVLRPVHAWFFLWEKVVPSLYRVVATGLAALTTAVVLVAVGVSPFLAASSSLLGWIGLAIAQEHDERILRPPDQVFVSALRVAVAQQPVALRVAVAHGSRRARAEPWDTRAVLTAGEDERHPLRSMYIAVQRGAAHGRLRLDVIDDSGEGYVSLEERLRERGGSALAQRVQRSQTPEGDAQAIADALDSGVLVARPGRERRWPTSRHLCARRFGTRWAQLRTTCATCVAGPRWLVDRRTQPSGRHRRHRHSGDELDADEIRGSHIVCVARVGRHRGVIAWSFRRAPAGPA